MRYSNGSYLFTSTLFGNNFSVIYILFFQFTDTCYQRKIKWLAVFQNGPAQQRIHFTHISVYVVLVLSMNRIYWILCLV